MLNDIKQQRIDNLTVVSPDIGGVVRARAVAKSLNADLAIIDKRRPKANVAEVMNIIGDIQGRTCLIVDDMIDTANTLCKAAVALKERGADRVLAYASHAVFSGEAVNRIASSEIDQVVEQIRFRCLKQLKNVNASVKLPLPVCWLKRYAVSAMKNPSHIFLMKK